MRLSTYISIVLATFGWVQVSAPFSWAGESAAVAPEEKAAQIELLVPITMLEHRVYFGSLLVPEKSEIRRPLDAANEAKFKGQFDLAREHYLKAFKLAGKEELSASLAAKTTIACLIAECLYQSGRTKSAELQLLQAQNLGNHIGGTSRFSALVALGYFYLREGAYSESEKTFNDLKAAVDPRSLAVNYAELGLGIIAAKQKRYEMARKYFHSMFVPGQDPSIKYTDPNYNPAKDFWAEESCGLANIAYCHFMEGNNEQAEKFFTASEELFPTEPKIDLPMCIVILKNHQQLARKTEDKGKVHAIEEKIAKLESKTSTFIKSNNKELETILKEQYYYKESLTSKIKRLWHPPKSYRGADQTVVEFTIDENGLVKDTKISHSSGVEELDRAGIKAIHDASPFPKPPKTIDGGQFEMQFTFVNHAYSSQR